MANNHQNSSDNITFVQADPSNFRAIVQRLTGAPFNLHERRQISKILKLNLTGPGSGPGLASPVSPFDLFGSPKAMLSPMEEEERAIAEKGFYLHPSPKNTPRGYEPELLPLFPVSSGQVNLIAESASY